MPAAARADAPEQEAELPLLAGGAMAFSPIRSAADPEEFSWRVQLGEGQELRQIDEREVASYKGEHLALDFFAEPAADAAGATVPTALKLAGEDVITLVVHHREGSPAAGGAPFTYPVTAGEGWNGGFGTYVVPMSPAETAPAPPSPESAPASTCQVPDLHGTKLDGARRRLRRAALPARRDRQGSGRDRFGRPGREAGRQRRHLLGRGREGCRQARRPPRLASAVS
jgi:hypothetical protein